MESAREKSARGNFSDVGTERSEAPCGERSRSWRRSRGAFVTEPLRGRGLESSEKEKDEDSVLFKERAFEDGVSSRWRGGTGRGEATSAGSARSRFSGASWREEVGSGEGSSSSRAPQIKGQEAVSESSLTKFEQKLLQINQRRWSGSGSGSDEPTGTSHPQTPSLPAETPPTSDTQRSSRNEGAGRDLESTADLNALSAMALRAHLRGDVQAARRLEGLIALRGLEGKGLKRAEETAFAAVVSTSVSAAGLPQRQRTETATAQGDLGPKRRRHGDMQAFPEFVSLACTLLARRGVCAVRACTSAAPWLMDSTVMLLLLLRKTLTAPDAVVSMRAAVVASLRFFVPQPNVGG
ncbi:hypothetical protein cyc_05902 [Cyclospora cayetanensis]|uniref:Uncharacterized protein n=1 Tax=Cyclospora cayetanensis TaxID=88456 RepID=A0A1D3D2Z4_9EIME|nr:hypothetical protein cyc_05902 [Cyclospora cayetanensis]